MMEERGKFTPKKPTRSSMYHSLYTWPERSQIVPVILAVASAGISTRPEVPSTSLVHPSATARKSSGVLETSIVPESSGMPNSANDVRQPNSTVHKVPPRRQSVYSQNKHVEQPITQRRNSCDRYLVPLLDQSTVEELNRCGTIIRAVPVECRASSAGTSTGSAGLPTPHIQSSTSTDKRQDGPSGTSTTPINSGRQAYPAGTSSGSAGLPTPQIQSSTSTDKRQDEPSGTSTTPINSGRQASPAGTSTGSAGLPTPQVQSSMSTDKRQDGPSGTSTTPINSGRQASPAGTSTGSAGLPTPQVQSCTSTDKSQDGPSGTSATPVTSGRQTSPAGTSTGSAGLPTPQIQSSTSTDKRQDGPSGTSIVPGTSGASDMDIPSASAVAPQSSTGGKTPIRRCKDSAKRGRGVTKSRNCTQIPSMIISRLIESGMPIERIFDLFRSEIEPLSTSIIPGTSRISCTCMPSSASAAGPQSLNGQKSPPSIQSPEVLNKDGGKTPTGEHTSPLHQSTTRSLSNHIGTNVVPCTSGPSGTAMPSAAGSPSPKVLNNPASIQGLVGKKIHGRINSIAEPNSSIVSSALPLNRGRSKSMGEHTSTNTIPATSGTSGTGLPSSTSAVGPRSSKGLNNPANIQGLPGQRIDGRRTSNQVPDNSAGSPALPKNCISESTGEHILTNDYNYFDELFQNVILISEQIKNGGQNICHPNTILENSNLFFKMLENMIKIILKMPTNVLKNIFSNNVDIFTQLNLLTTRFETLFNGDNGTSKHKMKSDDHNMKSDGNIMKSNNHNMKSDDHITKNDDHIIIIDDCSNNSNNSGIIDNKMEASKEPENRISCQLQIKCGENGFQCCNCVGSSKNIAIERLNILIDHLNLIAEILKNK